MYDTTDCIFFVQTYTPLVSLTLLNFTHYKDFMPSVDPQCGPPVSSDRKVPHRAAPAARLENFAEKITPVYSF